MRTPIPTLPIAPALARRGGLVLAGLRAGLGVVALVTPGVVGRPWIGDDADGDGARVFARALGGRDLALGLGALLAARHGGPVRGWIEAGALADLADTGATLTAFTRLPRKSRYAILALTLGAVLAGGLLAPLVDGDLG